MALSLAPGQTGQVNVQVQSRTTLPVGNYYVQMYATHLGVTPQTVTSIATYAVSQASPSQPAIQISPAGAVFSYNSNKAAIMTFQLSFSQGVISGMDMEISVSGPQAFVGNFTPGADRKVNLAF
jgi:hypothetical protein